MRNALFLILDFSYFYIFIGLDAKISQNFRKFIRQAYGIGPEQLTSRDDLGWFGSFGGGSHIAGRSTGKSPIVYIHGAQMTAGELIPVLKYYLEQGYEESEIYATTYSYGKLVNMPEANLKCVYVKEIRLFIHAVSAFTNSSDLTVVAYSQGVAVTRKAILGGPCMDTPENLGDPLTPIIETFLSISGVNHGSSLCDIPTIRIGPQCSNVTGIGCDSLFIADINSQQRYEARNIITMRSASDEIVNSACGMFTGEIAGSNQSVVLDVLSHNQMMFDTVPQQYALVTGRQLQV